MPNLTFVLPHWLYWSGLVIFPLVAMMLARRQRATAPPDEAMLSIAYLLLLTCGFVGIHRLYLRSKLGFAYVPLLVAILFGNARSREARNFVSDMRNELAGADFLLERGQKAIDRGTEGAADKLTDLQQALTAAQEAMTAAVAQFDQWGNFSLAFGVAILAFLLIDAFMLPRLTRRAAAIDREKSVDHADRTKIITDIITSVFFFIFTVTLLWTGWIFFSDSFEVLEVSFTEWAIQYWPVKASIFIGAALIILQGISKLATDIAALKRQGA